MEVSSSIAQTAQRCIQGLTECLAIPALMENEWAENRLADMNLWISGTGACARGRASLDSRLASKPEARDVVTDLLRLLAAVIDECKSRGEAPGLDNSQESSPSLEETSGRAFSPWSDDSSSDDESDNGYPAKLPSRTPLQESMYNVESMEDQLARIAVAIRRSGRRSRLQKADQRFDATEHEELEGYLISMLHTHLKHTHKTRDASTLNEVQLRLVRCNLKRRNRFLYAQRHSNGLDGGIMRPSDRKPSANRQGTANQDDIIDHSDNSNLPKIEHQNPNSTVITGTSASALSDSFMMPQTAPAAPAASQLDLEELRKNGQLRADESHQDDEAQSAEQKTGHDEDLRNSADLNLSGDFKPSPDLRQLKTPLEKINALAAWFHQVMIPRCEQYVADPPGDSKKRHDEFKKLSEAIITQVLLKVDGIEPDVDYRTRDERRSLQKRALKSLTDLESTVDGEHKADEQCPHPECAGHAFKGLKAHMLTHQVDRPEKCPIDACEYHVKGFARKYDRNRHVMTHYRGIIICGFCSPTGTLAEVFERVDVFKRHLISVHDVERIPPESSKDVSNKGRIFASDATGKCSICSLTFSNAQDFYEHLDDCALRAVQQQPNGTEIIPSYDANTDADTISFAFDHDQSIYNRVLIQILPALSSNEILLLRQAYKDRVTLNGKGVNLAKHLRLKLGTSSFGKACYATALGRWESETYWVTRYYKESPYRRELLIETLVGRSNNEIRQIKECFRDSWHENSLEQSMRSRLREGNFQVAILRVLEEQRQNDSELYDMKLVRQDVTDLHNALHSHEDRETAMINIIVTRSNTHLHLIISRLVRLHWEPQHLEQVKIAYRRRYNEPVEKAIAEQLASSEERDWRDFCIELVRSSAARFELD
ncbi:hypothetical protein N8T08_009505 [Aspergillus melleus]|uniref:Uncharacterized protein n=1 Tax=Aspergillus melleus TaxID=138277 RepID=A0ACC3BCN4_9EURO|nr:hypothetical protein N8T08_009505 [Aspergillus melleus]